MPSVACAAGLTPKLVGMTSNHEFTPEEAERGRRNSAVARKRYALERRLRATQQLTEGVDAAQLRALIVERATKPKVSAEDLRAVAALKDALFALSAQEDGPSPDAADQLKRLLSPE